MASCCKVIHVDNPPLGVEDEEERKINKRKREKSRVTLLKHLILCQDVYRPQQLQGMTGEISKLMIESKEKAESEATNKKERLEKLKNQKKRWTDNTTE